MRAEYTFDSAKQPLEQLALAVELTDIMWDLADDVAEGRIYVPASVLNQFSLTYQDIENRVYDQRFRDMMAYLAQIARAYFAEGWRIIDYFKPAERLAAGFGATVFWEVLNRMERDGFDVYSKPVKISKLEKVGLLLSYLPEYFGLTKRSWARAAY